ncbi:MAG TPA: rhamnulose-1-phosphate aldolase [Victivallales bacterium]|nr:rhamnulose-1-phosphate aldolase [Victivallales bacterium]
MNILSLPPIENMVRTTEAMWLKGWNEKNGGNISLRIDNDELSLYIDFGEYIRSFDLDTPIPKLAHQNFMITGKGKYFKNIVANPEESLGLIRISQDGKQCHLLWGFSDGCEPTRDLTSHLDSHLLRQEITKKNDRAIIHCHTSNLIALSSIAKLDTATLTRAIWEVLSEASIYLYQGIGYLPWMLIGSDEIGNATAELMRIHPIVLWANHGVFAAGRNIDQAFGTIEAAEKAAEILIKILSSSKKVVNYIKAENIIEQAKLSGVDLYQPALDVGEVIKTW